ncbi:MAG TPA: transketolase C-terminal domain-containing protein [Thermoanaerobaculia bacterium]|nr:transketolase C-terminal domain-containing protein [Thermoanaerobaculia bacterium]
MPGESASIGTRELGRESILRDYRIGFRSRQMSLVGRKEVLTGKAKFGIFGDGKEVAQLALARAARPGDFRSGYYRDQTIMLAVGGLTVEQFFAQLYADPDPTRDPNSAGRQMNAHFATPLVGPDGEWLAATERFNSSADVSPTGAQMPRLVGLAWASKLYRELPAAADPRFSRHGDEVAWGTIGNASCAEGMFWEALNAIGVLQGPAVISIWDDGYGISVPNEHQLTKGDLSVLLAGFQRESRDGGSRGCGGYDVYRVRGWDYPALCETYRAAADTARREHVPALVHVVEMTQPQGHSTSGSHERYKSPERLRWEEDHDPLRHMRQWMLDEGIATAEEIEKVEKEESRLVRDGQRRAWEEFQGPLRAEGRELTALLQELATASRHGEQLRALARGIDRQGTLLRRHLLAAAAESLALVAGEELPAAEKLAAWRRELEAVNRRRYSAHLHAEGATSPLAVTPVAPHYPADAPVVNGFEVLNACFDAHLARDPRVVAFGEDVGRLGDVNQGFAGLQEKHGPLRVSDTGIRETTIIGQAIGLALRGLRPIAEIQYLDYILYALQILSDDLATLSYRTAGRQRAPVIVRTRGHRLEGIWHSGSPMGGILNLVRGLWVCVPRDMTRAAGMYNTLLRGEDPAIVVEVLNGYRAKERMPQNVADFTVPLGVPEVLREGSGVTVVSYGATLRIVMEAAELLARTGVECEVIDVQTLLPFDRPGIIRESLRKTGRLVVVDEDVPGGASAFILQQTLEQLQGFWWLDTAPRTVTAQEHRPPYGSDGDYFAKPNREEIVEAVMAVARA